MPFREKESPVVKAQKVVTHSKVSIMVDEAINTLAEPNGSSLHAIKKFIGAHYNANAQKLSAHIKIYLKDAVESGDMIQPKGKGANGSFKINKQKVEVKPKDLKAKSLKHLKQHIPPPEKTTRRKKSTASQKHLKLPIPTPEKTIKPDKSKTSEKHLKQHMPPPETTTRQKKSTTSLKHLKLLIPTPEKTIRPNKSTTSEKHLKQHIPTPEKTTRRKKSTTSQKHLKLHIPPEKTIRQNKFTISEKHLKMHIPTPEKAGQKKSTTSRTLCHRYIPTPIKTFKRKKSIEKFPNYSPVKADTQMEKVDIQMEKVDIQMEKVNIQMERAETALDNADTQLEYSYTQLEKADTQASICVCVPAACTTSIKPLTKVAKKPKVSLGIKSRNSLVLARKKIKAKELLLRQSRSHQREYSKSPAKPKQKDATNSTKNNGSPKPGKSSPLILRKFPAKQTTTRLQKIKSDI